MSLNLKFSVTSHPTIIVLTDNEKLGRAVCANLPPHYQTSLWITSTPAPTLDVTAMSISLIVVALGSSVSEPVVLLGQAALGPFISHAPILIISDRPFRADTREQIHHLDFPFTSAMLSRSVNEILAQT